MQEKHILIGSLIHNREWILPTFLEHLKALNYDKKHISICFIVNNCVDNSFDILREFQKENEEEYRDIIIKINNFERVLNDDRMNRRIKDNEMQTYNILKKLRSDMIKIFYEGDYDYFFSVDSDILLNSEDLNMLIESNKDAVAGLIQNHETIKEAKNFLFLCGDSFYRSHDFKIPNECFEVGLTGAVILFSQNIFTFGYIDYMGEKFMSEDEEFCYKLIFKNGISLFVNPNVKPKHILSEAVFYGYN